MRPVPIAAAGIALAVLAGCAAQQTQTTPPTVTYSYADTQGYRQAARNADDYCLDEYRTNAYLVDRARTGTGYKATFSCE